MAQLYTSKITKPVTKLTSLIYSSHLTIGSINNRLGLPALPDRQTSFDPDEGTRIRGKLGEEERREGRKKISSFAKSRPI